MVVTPLRMPLGLERLLPDGPPIGGAVSMVVEPVDLARFVNRARFPDGTRALVAARVVTTPPVDGKWAVPPDIEPTLVFVPGHCYLAFNLDPEGKQVIGLETTLIGSQSDGETVDLPDVEDVVDAEWRKKNSWGTFCAAIAMGCAGLAENQSKFAEASDPDYQLIPIAAARRQGILPISFNPADPFESATSSAE